jgi:hypothetical protein
LLLRYHEADPRSTSILHADLFRSRLGQIQDASADVWSAIVDLDLDGLAVLQIGHHRFGAERQILVCGGQLILVEPLATGRFPAVETRTVPRRDALLNVDRLRPLGLSGFIRCQHRRQGKRHDDTCPLEPLKHRFDLPQCRHTLSR